MAPAAAPPPEQDCCTSVVGAADCDTSWCIIAYGRSHAARYDWMSCR
jgi:hypothetical protein